MIGANLIHAPDRLLRFSAPEYDEVPDEHER